jgi:hypothetical protein
LDEAQLGDDPVLGGGGDPDWLGGDRVTLITVVEDRDGVVTCPPPIEDVAALGKHCEYQGFPACETQVQPLWHRLGPAHPVPPHWPATVSVKIEGSFEYLNSPHGVCWAC